MTIEAHHPPATTSPGLRLPVYALRLVSRHREADGVRWYSGSAWTEDRGQFLGGERSVYTWLHAILGKPASASTEWTRLYWRIRDAAGGPLSRDRVPARFHHDVDRLPGLFQALETASWCSACHAAPALPATGYCAWCAAAPIGRRCA